MPWEKEDSLRVEACRDVAIAPLPIGELVARKRREINVRTEEIVTSLGSMFGNRRLKEGASDSLANGATVEVGKADNDRVNRPVVNDSVERVQVGHVPLLPTQEEVVHHRSHRLVPWQGQS